MDNKSDLQDSEEVDENEARNFAKEINAIFIKTSAKTSSEIKELFNSIGTKLLSQIEGIPKKLKKENNDKGKKPGCCDCL